MDDPPMDRFLLLYRPPPSLPVALTRRRVYCDEMGLTMPQEFTNVDPTSRHVLIQSEPSLKTFMVSQGLGEDFREKQMIHQCGVGFRTVVPKVIWQISLA